VTSALIIEPHCSGHHLTYLVEIVRGATARGVAAIVAVGTDHAGDVIASRLDAEFPGSQIAVLRVPIAAGESATPGALGKVRRNLRSWRFFARAHRMASAKHRIDFVFVPYLDNSLVAISLFGSPFRDTPFSGISMAQRFHFAEMGVNGAARRGSSLRKLLFLNLLSTRGLKKLFVIDDTLEAFVAKRRPDRKQRIEYLPDPSALALPLPKAEARAALGVRADGPLIIVYGALDQRKGIATLLSWLAGGGRASGAGVLLAGAVRDEIRPVLEGDSAQLLEAQRRLWSLPRYIEPREEALVFSAADVVWIAYDGIESLSGVMVKAALFEKAVLHRDFGLIGRYAARFGSPVSPERFGLPPLPAGLCLRVFDGRRSDAEPLPDHSWANACNRIFGCDDRA
jgi:hypothetical protein